MYLRCSNTAYLPNFSRCARPLSLLFIMASPPYRSPATSPPGPAHAALPNSRKRGPGSIAGTGNTKRRKPSSFSTSSSHPLRQTSFPPEEALNGAGERSPSVDSDYTAVTGNQSVAASTIGMKKRGRKKKDGAESVISGKGGADARSKTGAPDEEAEGEEDEEDDGIGGVVDEGEQGKVDKAAEKKKIAVLMDAFNEDQNERYNTYRRVKLKKETIRKIVNQTLSQSVPPSVITTINGFTKVFVGNLVERAREVQQQENHATQSLPTPPRTQETMTEVNTSMSSTQQSTQASSGDQHTRFKDGYIGPLLPDHIREAYRRYRKDGEGGGAGVSGYSVGLGLPGAGIARAGGKRLFR
jgi:transcription initiation factor TFIID subunit 11